MSNHLIYSIVVEKSEDGGLGMYFPDFPETAILSMDIADGIRKAKELLVDLMLEKEEHDQPLPIPSAPENIALFDANDRIVFGFKLLSRMPLGLSQLKNNLKQKIVAGTGLLTTLRCCQ